MTIPLRTAPRPLMLVSMLLLVLLAACGSDQPPVASEPIGEDPGVANPAAACLVGAEDCDDVPTNQAGPPTPLCAEGEQGCDEAPPAEPSCMPGDADCTTTQEVDVVDEFNYEVEMVTPAPGQTNNARAIPVSEAIVTDTGIRVAFYGGVAPCFVVDTATAVETEQDVVVTVTAGDQFTEENTACIEIAKSYAVDIPLEAPLGERTLLSEF